MYLLTNLSMKCPSNACRFSPMYLYERKVDDESRDNAIKMRICEREIFDVLEAFLMGSFLSLTPLLKAFLWTGHIYVEMAHL